MVGLAARGYPKNRGFTALSVGWNASAKALEQSATMGAGRWGERGGRERRAGGESTTRNTQVHNKAQQDTNNTREEEEKLKGGSGILRSIEAAVRISFRVGSGVCTYNKSGVPCTTRRQETVGGRQM